MIHHAFTKGCFGFRVKKEYNFEKSFHLVLTFNTTPDFIIVSLPHGGLNFMVVPTGASAPIIPPYLGLPNLVAVCVVPAKLN